MSVRAESTEFRPSSASSAKKKAADDAQFKKDLLELIPFLRAFARSLLSVWWRQIGISDLSPWTPAF